MTELCNLMAEILFECKRTQAINPNGCYYGIVLRISGSDLFFYFDSNERSKHPVVQIWVEGSKVGLGVSEQCQTHSRCPMNGC